MVLENRTPPMRANPLYLAWLLAALPAGAVAAAPTWIATCDTSAPGGPPGVRTFRVGAGLLQEQRADDKAFGPNLCLSFSCTGDRGKLEGRLESSSLIFTLSFDPAERTAAWHTVGASGLARTSGSCTVRQETAPSKVAAEGPK
jgi:hypothetical protein